MKYRDILSLSLSLSLYIYIYIYIYIFIYRQIDRYTYTEKKAKFLKKLQLQVFFNVKENNKVSLD